MTKQSFDAAVVGGGPGGYVAAIRAASAGLKTALVEEDSLGGVCLNWGCIPTKSLLRNAEILRDVRECAAFGIEAGGITADYRKAYRRSREVSERMTRGIAYLMKKNGVTVLKDTAAFAGPNELKLQNSGDTLSAKHIILAAGSRPARLPMLDYALDCVLDSKKALQLQKAPQSILIVGAGAIGMEFATVFRSYGAAVTVVEMLDRVLPNEDAEAGALVAKEFKKAGIDVHTGAKLAQAKAGKTGVCAVIEKAGKQFTVEAEYVLCAAGITPNSGRLALEKAGVKTDARGYIQTDDRMRTNVPGVWAVGDVTGKLALAHAASAQALLAVDDICGKPTEAIRYDNVPKCTYADPECASAGLTEEKARERGFDTGVAVFPFSANGKAVSYGQDAGFVKLVYDKKYGQLLGAHLVGAHVTEMVWGIAGYLGMEMTVEEMARVIHPHPTMSEAIMEAAHLAEGRAIHIYSK